MSIGRSPELALRNPSLRIFQTLLPAGCHEIAYVEVIRMNDIKKRWFFCILSDFFERTNDMEKLFAE